MHYFSYSQENQENKEVIICFLALFSTSLLTLVISFSFFFDNTHFKGHEVLSHCGFDLHFCNN